MMTSFKFAIITARVVGCRTINHDPSSCVPVNTEFDCLGSQALDLRSDLLRFQFLLACLSSSPNTLPIPVQSPHYKPSDPVSLTPKRPWSRMPISPRPYPPPGIENLILHLYCLFTHIHRPLAVLHILLRPRLPLRLSLTVENQSVHLAPLSLPQPCAIHHSNNVAHGTFRIV